MLKVLIVDQIHEVLIKELEQIGVQCDYKPSITYLDALNCIHNYQGVVIRSKFRVEKEFMQMAVNLKFIARAGAGTDNIDEKAAAEYGIEIFNAPEGNANAVAEHTLGMLLSLMNNMAKADKEVRNKIWDREGNRGFELDGLVVGIIGYGFMGPAFAKKLRGFDVSVIAYDKYKQGYSNDFVSEVSLEEIFERSDVLSLHIPLTDETLRMVNDSFFAKFKKPIWFINASRGEIVDSKALINAIRSNKIKGAALDVLHSEKFPMKDTDAQYFEDLSQMSNIIFTPHVAGWSYESYEKISIVLFNKIKTFLCK